MSASFEVEVNPSACPAARRRRGPSRDRDGLTVTELALHLGTTVRALRYYEESDLLTPVRSPSNARLYGPEARNRAALIVALRRADVPLAMIEAAIDGGPDPSSDPLIELLEARLQAAKDRVSDIARLLRNIKSG